MKNHTWICTYKGAETNCNVFICNSLSKEVSFKIRLLFEKVIFENDFLNFKNPNNKTCFNTLC